MLGLNYLRLSARSIFYKKIQKDFLKSTKRLEIEPIFIIGSNRSGTSVITKILEQHPQLCKTSKESKKDNGSKTTNGHYLGFSESTHLLEMLALKTFAKKCFSKWAHPQFISNTYLNKYENKIDASKLIQEISNIEKTGKRPIIKDQLNILRIKFLIDIFPKAKFIYVKRDLESYITSNIHKLNISNIKENKNEVTNICLHWMLCNLICNYELKSYAKERYIELNFETVTNKELLRKELKNILEFIDVKKIDLNLEVIDTNKKFKWEREPYLSKAISNAYEAFNEMTLLNGQNFLNY